MKHAHSSCVLRVDCVRGGGKDPVGKIVTQGKDGFIKVWDAEAMTSGAPGQPLLEWNTGACHFCQFALPRWGSSGGILGEDVLLAGCEDQTSLQLYDMRQSPQKSSARSVGGGCGAQTRGMVMCCRLLGAGMPTALAGYEDGSLCSYDLRKESQFVSAIRVHKEPAMCCDISPDCSAVVSGAADDQLSIGHFDLQSQCLSLSQTLQLESPGTACTEMRSDGKLFVTGGWDGIARLYSRKGALLASLRYHASSIYGVDMCPDLSGQIAVASKDTMVSLWHLYSGVTDKNKESTA
jgi:WD40 repeat protein